MIEIPMELVLKAQTGDQEAINEVVKRSQHLIYYFVRYYLKGRKYTDDFNFENLTQEGYISVWKALKKYDPNRIKFTSYASNRIKGKMSWELRKSIRKKKIFSLIEEADIPYKVKQNEFEYPFNTDQVIESINKLDSRSQKIIKQRYGIGCQRKKLKELSSELNISLQRVDQIASKALQTMKRVLMENS